MKCDAFPHEICKIRRPPEKNNHTCFYIDVSEGDPLHYLKAKGLIVMMKHTFCSPSISEFMNLFSVAH